MIRVIIEKSRGGRFLWNRNWDLGWIWNSLATFEAGFFYVFMGKIFFAHEIMTKPASKVMEPAQIQPKSQLLFLKNLPPRDFSIMTLSLMNQLIYSYHVTQASRNRVKFLVLWYYLVGRCSFCQKIQVRIYLAQET